MIDVERVILEELEQLAPTERIERDWQDALARATRPRKRHTVRLGLAAAAAFAALLAAAIALAADNHWHFFSSGEVVVIDPLTGHVVAHGRSVRAATTVRYHGRRWRVDVYVAPSGIGTALYGPNGEFEGNSAGGPAVGGRSRRRIAYTSYSERAAEGTIVYGAASGDTAVVLLFSGRRSWTTTPVPVAPSLHTTARVWAVVVPAAVLTRIEAVDRRGHVTEAVRLRPYGAGMPIVTPRAYYHR